MKCILLFLLLIGVTSLKVHASCEASVLEGTHSAMTEREAKLGAWEDATEKCYPGSAEKQALSCKVEVNEFEPMLKVTQRCSQQIVCTLCGEDLLRRQEALEKKDTL